MYILKLKTNTDYAGSIEEAIVVSKDRKKLAELKESILRESKEIVSKSVSYFEAKKYKEILHEEYPETYKYGIIIDSICEELVIEEIKEL